MIRLARRVQTRCAPLATLLAPLLAPLLAHFALLACCALPAPAHAETVAVPLQKLTAMPTIELRCISGSQTISLPIPARWKLNAVQLTLRYMASNNLIGDVSQLSIHVNEVPVAQTRLNPQVTNAELTITIPPSLLKPGYNKLSFHTAQHYSRQQCEPPCAPDLWTIISVADSLLTIDYTPQPVPLKLGAATAMIFDPTQFPEVEVHLVNEAMDQPSAALATVVASGIARRLDYRKTKFTISRTLKPGVDNVLIGSRKFAAAVLAGHGVPLSEGPGGLLKVVHLPQADGAWDRLHALLLLVDDRQATLRIAAETLANMTLPYPDADELHAIAFSMPNVTMYRGRGVLAADKPYTFKTLNQPNHTFVGLNAETIELNFRLPADFLIKQNQYAKMAINFAYGAGMRANSSLNLRVNGSDLRAIHLDNPAGGFVDGYKIEVPTYIFKPGNNTIAFTPTVNANSALCDPLKSDGLFVTLYENSTLYFPPMPHFVELPKIELFALNGFPFTRWPDGFETLIYLPEPDETSLGAMLNIVGMISQRNGFPLFGTQVTFEAPKQWAGEIMVVGKTGAIPKDFMDAAPLNPNGRTRVPYPAVGSWNSETTIAQSTQHSQLASGTGLIMEYESFYTKGRSIVLFTAQDNASLSALGEAMLDPGVQGGITGDLVFVDLSKPDYPVTSLNTGKSYTTGNKGSIWTVDSFLFANSYVFYGLIALLLLLLALVAYWGLRRFRAHRLGGTPPRPPQA